MTRPCDDELLDAGLHEALAKVRTSKGKYLSEVLDQTTLQNIVLQMTEGSSVFDDLIARHMQNAKPYWQVFEEAAVYRAMEQDATPRMWKGKELCDQADVLDKAIEACRPDLVVCTLCKKVVGDGEGPDVPDCGNRGKRGCKFT